ncbi:hypothetical protein S7711_10413 [Stachybotrys chartarum IBT 7711]|uniref:SNF2 N-terminal domain-containing protein n=1 Tax=Stachybotrys chartarum (strain CBS 109288 / IBT 7711) TaxID=1280523 RepID=A0A084B4A5_STACB|nr:hypothetical protein S7711_10413 [Stachybotrys chartarum IBT 7711]
MRSRTSGTTSFTPQMKKVDAIQPDGYAVTINFGRQKVWDKTKFNVVVVDEAHIARKMNGTFNHILRNLQCKSLLYVSGTPIVSTGRDLWDRCRVHCGDTGIDADLEIGRGQ